MRIPFASPLLRAAAAVVVASAVATAWPGAAPAPAAATRAGEAAEAEGVAAARLMERSLLVIRAERERRGLAIDTVIDPNRTGIIGDEFSPLTTSLGEADAKRTSATPAFAALITAFFRDAGLARGDVVAVGASGSFPGFALATLSAASVLGLEPIVIYSVGASMYGANLSGFTFADMLARLKDEGVLPYRIAAVSPGGEQDGGGGVLFDETGTSLVDESRRLGLPMVEGATLADRIRWRLRAYESAARGRPIRCFVNIGGAAASFGDTPASLEVPNGLVLRVPRLPEAPTRGLLFEFAARHVPVIHLLHVGGLARRHGLPYDPVPLPPIGGKLPAAR